METIFLTLSYSPGIFWLFILLAPSNKRAMLAVDIFLFILALSFSALTIPVVVEIFPIIANPTLSSIQGFLVTKQGATGTWNHMILADLWIGRWVAQDTLKGGYSKLTRCFFIPIILFYGPLGLCLYLIYRTFNRKTMSLT